MYKYLLISLLIIGFSGACIKPPPNLNAMEACIPRPDNYAPGIFIINRGTDERPGSVSYHNRTSDYFENKIYQDENNLELLGFNLFSMATFSSNGYLIENTAGRIVKVDLKDFKYLDEITGFELPRYMLPISGNKAYVSQWGADGVTGSIKIVDLTTNTITGTIPTLGGPDKMIQVGTNVYVANSGGFLIGNTVSKINILTDQVVETITVGDVPESLQLDKNNHLWVLTRGVIDELNPSNNSDGQLNRIVNDEVVLSLDTSPGAEDLVINNAGDVLYFNMDNWVYDHPITDTEISLTTFIDQFFVGLGVDPVNGNIYGANGANAFIPGQVVIFDPEGIEQSRQTVDFVPSFFLFE